MDAIKVKLIGLSRGGGGNLQPDKTATPTKQEQTVRADPGYDGLRQVTVEAIPDQYADVSGVDAGAGDVRVGKVIVGSDGETITGTMPPQKPEEIGHATPTEQAQTVTPTAGSVFSAVEVDAIPSEYADVSGVDATAADVRTGKIIVDAQGDTITGEMEPQKPEQVKSATPTTSPQSVTPDTGYALSRVDVGAIPSEYADVSDVTATAGTVLTGSDFVDASGTLVHGACDYDADTSDADATAGQIEAGATAYVGGAKVSGTMPIRTTDVEISDLSPVPIPAGSYDGTASAKLSSAAAAEVLAANIRQGAEILGVHGAYQGADTFGAYFDDTLTNFSNSTATAILPNMFDGKSALEKIAFSNVAAISNYAFRNCTSLTEADFPLATSLGSGAFQGCTSLTEADFPLATSLGSGAFQGCTSLTRASFGSLLTLSTGYGSVFAGCNMLSEVNMPSATSLAGAIFSGAPTLVRLVLPNIETANTSNALASWGWFQRSSGIQIVDFGVCIQTINPFVFWDAIHFNTLIIRADSVPTLANTNAFDRSPFASTGTGGSLYIKQSLYAHLGDGTADDYLNATNWSVLFSGNPNNQILPIEGSPYEVTT